MSTTKRRTTAGFAGDHTATAATMGRALHGRRAARVQRAAHGAQGGHVLRLPARWGHVWPRARAATVAGARFHDRRGAGHPRRPHRGASKHVCARPGPLQGARAARRRAHGVRLDCPRRAVRARAAEDAGLPAGGRYFVQSPPGSMKTSSRTRRSCLSGVCLVRVFGPNTRQHRQQQQQE